MKTEEIPEFALSLILHKSGLLKLGNRLRYGMQAPFPEIRLTIPPELLKNRYHASANGSNHLHHWRTGQVLDGDWDHASKAFSKSIKYKACRQHFIKGIPWNETRAISYGLNRIAEKRKYDNCLNEADLRRRYDKLDDLWSKTLAAKAFPAEITENTRLQDNIIVHIIRDGTLIFGNKGFHRLAIAKLAKLDEITVVLGATHKEAVLSGTAMQLINRYRQS